MLPHKLWIADYCSGSVLFILYLAYSPKHISATAQDAAPPWKKSILQPVKRFQFASFPPTFLHKGKSIHNLLASSCLIQCLFCALDMSW